MLQLSSLYAVGQEDPKEFLHSSLILYFTFRTSNINRLHIFTTKFSASSSKTTTSSVLICFTFAFAVNKPTTKFVSSWSSWPPKYDFNRSAIHFRIFNSIRLPSYTRFQSIFVLKVFSGSFGTSFTTSLEVLGAECSVFRRSRDLLLLTRNLSFRVRLLFLLSKSKYTETV